MLKQATIRVVSLLCVLIATGSAFGQVDLDTTYPYTGMINGTKVRVRSGRGDPSGANNYYYCAILDSPAKVTVVGADKGWLAVLPPEGCYSVVLQSAIKTDITGTKGTMIKLEWARAAGTARTSEFRAGQVKLPAGTAVEILGTVSDGSYKFYKIKSPKNVRFWIYATLVDKVGSAAIAKTPKDPSGLVATTTQPANSSSTTKPAVVTTTNKTTDSKLVGVTDEQMKEFRAVQGALRTEYAKPVLNRDYTSLIDKFQAIKLETGHPLIPFVNYYVQYLRGDRDRIESILAARQLSTDAADAQREFDAARTNVTVTVPPKPLTFDADGIIAESRMFSGTSAVRKRYIVYDRKTHRLNAYVYSTDSQVDLASVVGKHIGVFGDSKYDKGLGANIINVRQIEVIDDKAGVPVLDKPVVRAGPKPKVPAPLPKPLTIPKPIPPTGKGGITKPTPLIDLVPKVKPADTKKPAPIIKPVPLPTTRPKTVGTVDVVKPKPVEIVRPKPVEVVKPKPVDVAKPKPVEVVKPKPVDIAKPKPVDITKPKPVDIAKPKPVDIAKPIDIAKPKPVDIAKPKPIDVAKPKPVDIAKPKPVDIVKPKPVDITKPPLPKVKPLPTTRPAAATTRPSKLIDLESINKRPTTRPASTDAIPAPTKRVKPEDFPMPLPPSGLPLLDVKKTPTTVPVNESEFD
ncbi:MAG: hypothetical protein QGG42_18640 [Phycisphaerae bacterium]|jgi:hypothetical protein|nr:hypothetical protein [Phycisphaerae bacterium]